MAHEHDHTAQLADHRVRLALVLALTVTVMVAEAVGAVVTGSLSLLADAGHMLSDVAGLCLGLTAAALARRPPTLRHTWGLRRAEVLGAATQAALLLVVGGLVLVESLRRLLEAPEVTAGGMLVVGALGLVSNLIGLGVLTSVRGVDLNLRAAFLEVLADTLGSVAVLAAAAVIALTGWTRADAVASLLIVVLIVPRTLALLRETSHVLLEGTPRGVDLDEVRERIVDHPHVLGVHDLHASQVATGLPVLSAHVVVDDECFHDGHVAELLDQVQACLADDFDIGHSTIQFERAAHGGHEQGTHA